MNNAPRWAPCEHDLTARLHTIREPFDKTSFISDQAEYLADEDGIVTLGRQLADLRIEMLYRGLLRDPGEF